MAYVFCFFDGYRRMNVPHYLYDETMRRCGLMFLGSKDIAVHSQNVLNWVKKLGIDFFKTSSGEHLFVAALCNDMEKMSLENKISRKKYKTYLEFRKASNIASARVASEMIESFPYGKYIASNHYAKSNDKCSESSYSEEVKSFSKKVYTLISNQEDCNAGDLEDALLRSADAMSFFDDMIILYSKRNSAHNCKKRCEWEYNRISVEYRSYLSELTHVASDRSLREFIGSFKEFAHVESVA